MISFGFDLTWNTNGCYCARYADGRAAYYDGTPEMAGLAEDARKPGPARDRLLEHLAGCEPFHVEQGRPTSSTKE